jgi:hypothetical protein
MMNHRGLGVLAADEKVSVGKNREEKHSLYWVGSEGDRWIVHGCEHPSHCWERLSLNWSDAVTRLRMIKDG